MKDKKWSYLLLAAVLCIFSLLGGCQETKQEATKEESAEQTETETEATTEKQPLRIGLILSSKDDAENEATKELFQALASELGAELIVKTPDVTAEEAAGARELSYHSFVLCDVNPVEYQMLAVDDLVAEKADLIVIHANHREALEGVLAAARGIGIRVIAWEQELTEGSFDIYTETAEEAAEQIRAGSAL